MRPSEVLPQHRETIRQLVLEAGMANPRVFGSVLRGEDQDGSDLEILVDPSPRTSLLDMAGLQMELEKALGVKAAAGDDLPSHPPPLRQLMQRVLHIDVQGARQFIGEKSA